MSKDQFIADHERIAEDFANDYDDAEGAISLQCNAIFEACRALRGMSWGNASEIGAEVAEWVKEQSE